MFFQGRPDEGIEVYDAVLWQGIHHRKQADLLTPQLLCKRDVAGGAAISNHEVLRQGPEAKLREEFQKGGIDGLVDADEIAWLGEQQCAFRLVRQERTLAGSVALQIDRVGRVGVDPGSPRRRRVACERESSGSAVAFLRSRCQRRGLESGLAHEARPARAAAITRGPGIITLSSRPELPMTLPTTHHPAACIIASDAFRS